MDSLITAAARALAAGDPLGALKRVALRDDAPALALRGIAMAQLGDLVRAKDLLQASARAHSARRRRWRARGASSPKPRSRSSRATSPGLPRRSTRRERRSKRHGDRVNAAHAGYLEARRLLLIGRLDEAERLLSEVDPTPLPPALRAAYELAAAGIAIRRLQTEAARAALARAEHDGAGSRHRRIEGGGGKCRAAVDATGGASDRAWQGTSSSCWKRSRRSWLRVRLSSTLAATL